jgi:hypothetical protein
LALSHLILSHDTDLPNFRLPWTIWPFGFSHETFYRCLNLSILKACSFKSRLHLITAGYIWNMKPASVMNFLYLHFYLICYWSLQQWTQTHKFLDPTLRQLFRIRLGAWTQQCPSFLVLSCSVDSAPINEPEGPLPCSQRPSTGPHLEPDAFSPHLWRYSPKTECDPTENCVTGNSSLNCMIIDLQIVLISHCCLKHSKKSRYRRFLLRDKKPKWNQRNILISYYTRPYLSLLTAWTPH